MAFDTRRGISNQSSKLYRKFEEAASELAKLQERGCTLDDAMIETFNKEWKFQQARETERVVAFDKLRLHNEAILAEAHRRREAQKRAMAKEAQKRGFKRVLFDHSLTAVISELRAGAISLRDLKKIVIELDDENDHNWIALQQLSKSKVLYINDHLSGMVVMLRTYKKTVIEGSPLTALDTSYFTVTGTKRYKTALGTKQAIVIEPAL